MGGLAWDACLSVGTGKETGLGRSIEAFDVAGTEGRTACRWHTHEHAHTYTRTHRGLKKTGKWLELQAKVPHSRMCALLMFSVVVLGLSDLNHPVWASSRVCVYVCVCASPQESWVFMVH